MTFPANPALGEQNGQWQWDGERWRCTAPGGSANPNPCPPPSDGTVGPAYIESTMDGVTCTYSVFNALTQLMLTPGDWDVWANADQQQNPLFVAKNFQALIWGSPTLPLPQPTITTNRGGRSAFVLADTDEIQSFSMPLGPMRWLVSVPTPVYLLLFANPAEAITSTTYIGNGFLAARRHGPWAARSAQQPLFEVFAGAGNRNLFEE